MCDVRGDRSFVSVLKLMNCVLSPLKDCMHHPVSQRTRCRHNSDDLSAANPSLSSSPSSSSSSSFSWSPLHLLPPPLLLLPLSLHISCLHKTSLSRNNRLYRLSVHCASAAYVSALWRVNKPTPLLSLSLSLSLSLARTQLSLTLSLPPDAILRDKSAAPALPMLFALPAAPTIQSEPA